MFLDFCLSPSTTQETISSQSLFSKPLYTYAPFSVTSVLPAHEFAKNRILVCENEEFGTFKLLLWNKLDDTGFGSDLTPFADMVWPFATLYVTEVYRHAERDDDYNTSAKSLVVLEPDYLIEVKNLL